MMVVAQDDARDYQLWSADALCRAYAQDCGGDAVFPVDVEDIAARIQGVAIRRARLRRKDGGRVFGCLREGKLGIEICVNEKLPEAEVRFLIAHALGHYSCHWASGDVCIEEADMALTRKEAEANRFAEELTMPADAVRGVCTRMLFPTARRLARRFGVPKRFMERRLRKLGLKRR